MTLVPAPTVPLTASASAAATIDWNSTSGNQNPSPEDLTEPSTRIFAPAVRAEAVRRPKWMPMNAAYLVETSMAPLMMTLLAAIDCSVSSDEPIVFDQTVAMAYLTSAA